MIVNDTDRTIGRLHQIIDDIVECLACREWSADTTQQIAETLRAYGYKIPDIDAAD